MTPALPRPSLLVRAAKSAERLKPLFEVAAYLAAASWVLVGVVGKDLFGEYIPAGEVVITHVRRVGAAGTPQRLAFDATFTPRHAAWKIRSAKAQTVAIADQVPAATRDQEPTKREEDGCGGSLYDLATKFERLEADTPYTASCLTSVLSPSDVCYRVQVSVSGRRSLLLVGTHLSGDPSVAAAQAISCPGEAGDPGGH